jgi:hypothetical protein
MQSVTARVKHITSRQSVLVATTLDGNVIGLPTRSPDRPLLVYQKAERADVLGAHWPEHDFGFWGAQSKPRRDRFNPVGFDNWNVDGHDECAVCLGRGRLVDLSEHGPRRRAKPRWSPESEHDAYDWRPSEIDDFVPLDSAAARLRRDDPAAEDDPTTRTATIGLEAPGMGKLPSEQWEDFTRAWQERSPLGSAKMSTLACPECGDRRGTTAEVAWQARGTVLCDRCLASSGYGEGKPQRRRALIHEQRRKGKGANEIARAHGMSRDYLRQQFSKEEAPARQGQRGYAVTLYAMNRDIEEIARMTGLGVARIKQIMAEERKRPRFVPAAHLTRKPVPILSLGSILEVGVGTQLGESRFHFEGRRNQRLVVSASNEGHHPVLLLVHGPSKYGTRLVDRGKVEGESIATLHLELDHKGTHTLELRPTWPGYHRVMVKLASTA